MMRKLIITFLLVNLILSACASKQDTSPLPDIGIPETQFNQEIEIRVPNGWNTFKLNAPITLEIYNVSQNNIIFEYNYGVRMFVETQDEWIEVEDRLIAINKDDVVIRPTQIYPRDKGVISVAPKINEPKNSVNLKIFVIGYILNCEPTVHRRDE